MGHYGCKCAIEIDEFHGWGCTVSGDHCVYLIPNSKSCAKDYGEGPDADPELLEDEEEKHK
jgi:hypothetical protein